MKIELKKTIINYIIENNNLFNRMNNTVNHFKRYIYDENGEYMIWGEEVYDFIKKINELI